MKKYLIRTVLVLAAITACNKEVETHVVDNGQEEVTPGMVTMTFTAAMGEETRTAYPDDKTGKWVVGDQITVCVTKDVTDGEQSDYKLYNFTATGMSGELMEFSGSVKDGYTTIVSGIYPVSNKTVLDDGEVVSNHVFTAGAVTSVYLPDTYNLGTANDGGIALPMVGEMVVPEGSETPTFTFHHICGALKITVVDIFNALTFTTAGETITGDFELDEETGRIKMPENGTSSTVTFNYDRLSSNPDFGDRYNRTFYIPIPDGTVTAGATMALKNANKTSTFFDKTTTADIEFDSNKIKRLPAIGFNTPEGWSINFQEVENGNKFKINYSVTSGTYYSRLLISKSEFNESYKGSIARFVEERLPGLTIFPSSNQTYTSKYNIETYFAEKDYISFMFGVIPSDPDNLDDKTGRKITFEFFKLDYSLEEPTQDYLAWIGKWSVYDGESTDTWTITRKQANKTYTVTGLCNNTTNPKKVEAIFNDGKLKFMSQFDFASFTSASNGKKYQLSLVMVNSSGAPQYNNYVPYSIMQASKPNEGSSTLSKLQSNFSRYNLIAKQTHESTSYSPYGTARKLPATMTRVPEQ